MSDEGGQPVESYTIRRASPREDLGQRVYLSLPGPLNTLHDKDDRSNMLANHSRLIRSSRLQLATQWREALSHFLTRQSSKRARRTSYGNLLCVWRGATASSVAMRCMIGNRII
jgi:hypothetical protein